MKNSKIAIIGVGNIGSSLLGGLIADGIPANNIWITGPNHTKLQTFKNQYHVNISLDNVAVIDKVDVVILAVKVNTLKSVLHAMTDALQTYHPLLISIAAGVEIASLENSVGKNIGIVRAMPNTPALLRAGMTALIANKAVTVEQQQLAEAILRAVGAIVWLQDERLMDVVTALSGSGPAYFFLIIEALQHAGEKLGLSAEVAKLLTIQTAQGAVRMALQDNTDVKKLRKQVTSPGGTTECAVNVLEDHQLRDTLFAALKAATLRAKELAKQFADS